MTRERGVDSKRNLTTPSQVVGKNIQQMTWNNIDKYYPQYAKLSDLGSYFGVSCLNLSSSSAFVLRPIFRNLCGVPAWTNLDLAGILLVRST